MKSLLAASSYFVNYTQPKADRIRGLFLVLFYLIGSNRTTEGFAMFAASAKRNTERCSVRQTCASLCGISETLASGEGFTLR